MFQSSRYTYLALHHGDVNNYSSKLPGKFKFQNFKLFIEKIISMWKILNVNNMRIKIQYHLEVIGNTLIGINPTKNVTIMTIMSNSIFSWLHIFWNIPGNYYFAGTEYY